ncbi:MAG: UDP-N-acetylglucosamine pyrophosphorylase [Pseudomonadota bacterium]|jgi:bifunctional UDP-N-acetylglucosamine pyrophosphorylase/glucosamine-1-phosphate N-acetyltransferase
MHSNRPKVLYTLAGVPLLQRVIQTANRIYPAQLLIVHGSAQQPLYAPLLPAKPDVEVTWVHQEAQLGTGHAVSLALEQLAPNTKYVMVLYGDMPLITEESLQALLNALSTSTLSLLVGKLPCPTGFGRIVRNPSGDIQAIVEEKDATAEQKHITEVNSGIYAFPVTILKQLLPALTSNNQQGEYYLTDIIALSVQHGFKVVDISPQFSDEIQGVNTFSQLAQLERIYQSRLAESLMAKGVHIVDPHRLDIRGNIDDIQIAPDVHIDVNVILEGKINLSADVRVGANVYLKDTIARTGTTILANSYIEGATIGEMTRIGPFARIRPKTNIGAHAGIGNFVEVKQSQVGNHSKINHLSYVGDSTLGQRVNIGAGTITCNYDGAYKHPTILEDNVSIGAGVQLVAPVIVRKQATVGAGTVVVKDVPEASLVYNRLDVCLRPDWERPRKPEMDAPPTAEER